MAIATASRPRRDGWSDDPAGLQFIRGDLLPAVAAVACMMLLAGIVLGRGSQALYLVLLALAGVQLGLIWILPRIGRPVVVAQHLRIVLATTPATFVLLGMAGWNEAAGAYFPGVPAIIAGVVAMVVAMTQPGRVLAAWAIASSIALLGGGLLRSEPTAAVLLLPVSLLGQAGLAWMIRGGAERFHADRRAIVRRMAALTPSADPAMTAASIVGLLQSWDEFRSVLVLRFTALGETVVLAATGERTSDDLHPGEVLPASRNELLRRKAAAGPWLTSWTVRPEDGVYGLRIAGAGISAAAYVPVVYEDRTLGLIVVAEGAGAAEGLAVLAERLPVLIEMGELAGSLLASGLEAVEATSAEATRLDTILTDRAFQPVFQPIHDLRTGEIVGHEALTRFAEASPDEVFTRARLLGRLRELEVATLKASFAAARQLPRDRWLSVNVSPAMLADTATLRRLMAGSLQPIVLELSEHEAVPDYRLCRASMERLKPMASLAIDDAGAGFSSLRHILEMSPAWVKLDIALVRGVDLDPARQALVAGLVHFARRASIALIAEGIETPAEAETLRSLGVELGQGYLLGRPAPLDDARVEALRRQPLRRVRGVAPAEPPLPVSAG